MDTLFVNSVGNNMEISYTLNMSIADFLLY